MTFKIKFGPVTLAWVTDEADIRWREFQAAYGAYSTDKPASITIEASIADVDASRSEPDLPNSFMRMRKVIGNDFNLGDRLITGTIASGTICRCDIHPALLSGTGLRVLEQFLYLLFQHAVRLQDRPRGSVPFLLHCCAVRGPRGALIFCGPSGSGKSTIASLCPPGCVLTDECAIIIPGSERYMVTGSPVNPTFRAKISDSAPLSQIYLISHGKANTLSDITGLEAIPRLTAEIMVPVGLLETDIELAMSRALDMAIGLSGASAVKDLEFLPNKEICKIVLDELNRDSGDDHAQY